MLIFENIGLAFLGIRANKTRAGLTMLGIVIGIAAVICILTVSDAINNSVMSSMGDIGLNKISAEVSPKNYNDYNETTNKMTEKDYVTETMLIEMMKELGDQIKGICLSKSIGTGKAQDNKKYANVTVNAVNTTYLKDKKISLIEGSLFSKAEQSEAKKVILVSELFVKNMFGGDAKKACGQSVSVAIDNKYYGYTIIGVYKYDASIFGVVKASDKEVNTEAYIPLKTGVQQLRGTMNFTNFDVIGKDGVDINALTIEVTNFFNKSYYAKNDIYEIYTYNMASMVKQTSNMMNMLRAALVGIAGISLLVGGIGVMNIMIVSVTERTREIGTRKALGATNGSIRLQFITEAIVICLMGGIIGVVAGIAFGQIALKFMNYKGQASPQSILFCLLFSVGFGVFFGYHPASKAAKMNPIEALRYE